MFIFVLEINQSMYELLLLWWYPIASVSQCFLWIWQLRSESTLKKLKISCWSTITYFWFNFDDVWWAVSSAVWFIFFLLGFLLFSLNSTLYFRYHTFRPHTDAEALFQPALLTLSSHIHVYFAIVSVFALIHSVLCYTASEETFATLASQCVVMVTGRSVSAHQT